MKRFKTKDKTPNYLSPLEGLQLIFIVLKLAHLVDWSWAGVFSPTIAHLIFLAIGLIISLVWEWMG